MKKLMIAVTVLSLVLAGVAMATAADQPQTSKNLKNLELSGFQKITDQEAQEIRGTAGFGPQFGGFAGLGNPACPLNQTSTITTCIPDRLQTRINRK